MTWDQVKNMTPWTITKKNLMQDRIARIVRGQITDENGHPITASPKVKLDFFFFFVYGVLFKIKDDKL